MQESGLKEVGLGYLEGMDCTGKGVRNKGAKGSDEHERRFLRVVKTLSGALMELQEKEFGWHTHEEEDTGVSSAKRSGRRGQGRDLAIGD